MPLYDFTNPNGDTETHYLRMSDLDAFKADNPHLRQSLSVPMVVSDISPYACPITGEMITSRSQHRDNLAKHGMRVMEPSESPTKGAIRNEAFAKKRGLKVSDQFKDYDSSVALKAKEAAHG